MSDLFGHNDDMLPTISLWQPWASLCFVADPDLRKEHETRHWRYPAKYEGRTCAMHAAKRFPVDLDPGLDELCIAVWGAGYRDLLPRGALLGTFTLAGCYRAENVRHSLTASDLIAGDYSDGRFAWRMRDPRKLAAPIPLLGNQGWWKIKASTLTESPRP